MAKKKKKQNNTQKNKKSHKEHAASKGPSIQNDYLFSMSMAPQPGESNHVFQLIPAAFFTAFVIMIVRLYNYTRDMNDYYWSSGTAEQADFFSHYKVVAIVICAVLALILLLYKVFTQSLYIKRSILYIPALVYVAFTLLSFAFSSNKDVAWMGWNDRFEGTLVLLCYIFLAFYIYNMVNSEKNVKMIIYPLAVSSGILSIIGVTQALDKDFFRTSLGQKIIVPNVQLENGSMAWEAVDAAIAKGELFLKFTFQQQEIYQTVYNINYVSFYLTLLIPIFGLLFIQEKSSIVKKIIWGVLFALLVFNLIGSASSGGLLGMFVVLIMGIVLFNKKLIAWWKPLIVLVVITLVVGGITYDRWQSELSNAVNGVMGKQETQTAKTPASGTSPKDEPDATLAGASGHKFDYMENEGNNIKFSLDGNVATIDMKQPESFIIYDSANKPMQAQQGSDGTISIQDKRFDSVYLQPSSTEEGTQLLVLGLKGEDKKWPFTKTDSGVEYLNDLGNTVKLENVPHWGFKDNPGFGSGRGYIWSRTFPMVKDTILIGHGADTYCLYFPHKDYVGKYNADWNPNMIVDKPHNMYLGVAINTGLLSLLGLLAFFGIYIVQSFKLYFRKDYESFSAYAGAGIFIGICGFLVAGMVNDSSVSVMPMFYGLLGTGMAINQLIKKKIIS